MHKKEWMSYADIAKAAAKMAGESLKKYQKEWKIALKEEGHDIKLAADHSAEQLILKHLKTHSHFPILTEESGWHGQLGEYTWVVDPLDGSLNYHRSHPLCCVSIALLKNEEPIVGVIYDFNRDEMFYGVVGVGAFLNDEPIHVSDISEKRFAILNTGFPTRFDFSPDHYYPFMKSLPDWKKVRMLGTAALALVYVACARADAYDERFIMFWDVAAGMAIVEAAGGTLWFDGDDLTKPCFLAASNGLISMEQE